MNRQDKDDLKPLASVDGAAAFDEPWQAEALAIAGASLTPSPTMATSCLDLSCRIDLTLSSGNKLPRASSIPTDFAMASLTL